MLTLTWWASNCPLALKVRLVMTRVLGTKMFGHHIAKSMVFFIFYKFLWITLFSCFYEYLASVSFCSLKVIIFHLLLCQHQSSLFSRCIFCLPCECDFSSLGQISCPSAFILKQKIQTTLSIRKYILYHMACMYGPNIRVRGDVKKKWQI